jgi:methionyl-tRNA synthetase
VSNRRFYITTAIDYVNSAPHLGTAYEKIAADALARYHRLAGDDTRFVMGTDEHSQNVEKAARKEGLDPQAYTDRMATRFEDTWKALDISHDDFIRTSEPRHHRSVQAIFAKIDAAGDIHKGHYEGWYCVGCEAFKPEKDLVDGLCPNHRTKPDWVTEENYFFALSRYQEKLLAFYEAHPDFLVPVERRNEIVNVVKSGLDDISVTRTNTTWGIPLPKDPGHVIYVWFDALTNYASAVGHGQDSPDARALYEKWWPADLHVIGKDITRFHCIIWPAMLMSAGLPLPKQVLGHGWVTFKGEKMSKSLGNIVDPLDLAHKFGPDALRYYLLREVPLDRDGDFTWDLFIERYNAELANDFGNLVSRSLAMAEKYFGGALPADRQIRGGAGAPDIDADLLRVVAEALPAYREAFERHAVDEAIAAVRQITRRANQYIEETAPWTLAKQAGLPAPAGPGGTPDAVPGGGSATSPANPEAADRLAAVLNALLECVRLSAALFAPIIPRKAAEAQAALCLSDSARALRWGELRWEPHRVRPAANLARIGGLFPRIESAS